MRGALPGNDFCGLEIETTWIKVPTPTLGQNATANFTLKVKASTKPSVPSTTNTATITTTSLDPTLTDNTATVKTPLLPSPDFVPSSPALQPSPARLVSSAPAGPARSGAPA